MRCAITTLASAAFRIKKTVFLFLQAAIGGAKSDAECARRDFDTRRAAERTEIEERLGKELVRLQKEVAAAKSKAAMDVSRAQVDSRQSALTYE